MTDVDDEACGCGQDDVRRGISRRGFLGAVGAGALTAMLAPSLSRVAFADTAGPADTLVVVDLRGGMDGLSLVAPVGDPWYARLRPTIAVPASSGIATGDRMFALHPSLAPLTPFWKAGTFGAVHAVAQPDESRSHFQSQFELDRAAPGSSLLTGWLERAIVALGTTGVLQSATLGSSVADRIFAGPTPVFATGTLADATLWGSDDPAFTAALRRMNSGSSLPWATAVPPTLGALRTCASIVAHQKTPAHGAVYPDGDLGAALADVARLIKAKTGLRFASVDFGSWDMHAGLGTHGTGWMADQTDQLARALAAFATDIGPVAFARTSVLTVSEFGRRAGENGAGGVDHGHGSAALFLGGGLAGGSVRGSWPTLRPAKLDQGDLAGTTDYRDLFAELLVKRCGLPTSALPTVFPDYTPTTVGITR